MNTPTPRTDTALRYCKTGNESGREHMARYSVSGIQKIIVESKVLERELTAVTEQRDGLRSGIDYASDQLCKITEQRDEWKAKFIQQNKDLGCEMMDPNGTIWDYAKKLQTELAAVTEQLKETREELETERIRLAVCGVVAMADTKKTRTKAREMLPEYRSASLSDVERRVDECIKLREQRDRLAEALHKVVTSWDEATWLDDNEFEAFREALQFLNQPTEP